MKLVLADSKLLADSISIISELVNEARIKITMPPGATKAEVKKHIKTWKGIIESIEKLVGEEGQSRIIEIPEHDCSLSQDNGCSVCDERMK